MGAYETLGLQPVINAWGTVTAMGGSLMAPEVLEAMSEASRSFVDLRALHRRAGEAIARMLGVPAACVTSGASAGLTVAAAACMGRNDSTIVAQLPDTTGLRNVGLILSRHRNRYDQAVRLSGMTLSDVGTTASATIEDVASAISDRTGMFLYLAESEFVPGSLPLGQIAAALAPDGIPLVVDAAAELPPHSNIAAYLEQGADLVVVSGGKEIRGPQSSGLILGSERLIGYCEAHCFPNHSIGRGMKTDKETIVGLFTAVELFVRRDEQAAFDAWETIVAEVVCALCPVDGLQVRRGFPTGPGVQPVAIPRVYVTSVRYSAEELRDRLLDSDPPVAVGVENDEIAINPQCLSPAQVPVVIRAVIEANA